MIMLMNKRTANDVRILQRSSIELMVTPTGFRNLDGWSRSGDSFYLLLELLANTSRLLIPEVLHSSNHD